MDLGADICCDSAHKTLPVLTGGAYLHISKNAPEYFRACAKHAMALFGSTSPSYLILASGVEESVKEEALRAYGLQLAVNFLWPTFFFNFQWYAFSFFWLLLLWVLVIVMITRFWKINKVAAYLNVPYLIWLTFAAYLNWGIWRLNA